MNKETKNIRNIFKYTHEHMLHFSIILTILKVGNKPRY